MPRNLDRRVEVITPIKDQDIAKDIQEVLGIMLADNRQAWELNSNGNYIQRKPRQDCPEAGSQKTLMQIADYKSTNTSNSIGSKKNSLYLVDLS